MKKPESNTLERNIGMQLAGKIQIVVVISIVAVLVFSFATAVPFCMLAAWYPLLL